MLVKNPPVRPQTMKLPFFPTCRLNYDDRIFVRYLYRKLRKVSDRGTAKMDLIVILKVGKNI